MPVLSMKKTDCSRWLLSSRFGRMVYAGYNDLLGRWTAEFRMTLPAIMPAWNVPPTHLGRTHQQTLGRTYVAGTPVGAPSAKVRDGVIASR